MCACPERVRMVNNKKCLKQGGCMYENSAKSNLYATFLHVARVAKKQRKAL